MFKIDFSLITMTKKINTAMQKHSRVEVLYLGYLQFGYFEVF
jgi:hypothetical protein